MKYYYLFSSFIPHKKCGIDPVSASIMGGVNVGSSILSSVTQSRINDKNIENQRRENALNRQFNHDEADLQRKLQSADWKRQFNMQSGEWDRQQSEMQRLARENFLFEADYNSPKNQIARMQEAGINPAAAGGAQGLMSAASGNLQNQGSVSVPSGGSVSGSSASFSGGQLPAMQNPFKFSEIGSFLKDLSDVYISNSKLRPEIDNLTYDLYNKYLDSQGKQILNGINGIELSIKSVTKNSSIGKAFQDWRNAITQEYLNMALKGEADSRTSLNAVENLLKQAETKIKGKEYDQLVFAVTNQQKAFDNMLKNDAAKRASDYASAANQSAQATTENASRKWTVEHDQWVAQQGRLDYDIKLNEKILSDKTVQSRIKASVSQAENLGLLNDEIKKRITLLEKEGNWYEINTIISAISSVGTMVSKFK